MLKSYTEAIRDATDLVLRETEESFVSGLGVSYANGADGTTAGLAAKFPGRVLDMPVSEAANTGMCVGAAICGMRPIVHHGRVEFAMFAADSIFTQAGKWGYMYGGEDVPITFRICVGRQWGNGPQHTWSPYALFGAAPGLTTVIPSTPEMAQNLLYSACLSDDPIVVLEPRWLYKTEQDVGGIKEVSFGARRVRKGFFATIVSYGDGLIEAVRAADELKREGLECDVIDLVSLGGDLSLIEESVRDTNELITVDTCGENFSVGRNIAAAIEKRSYCRVKNVCCRSEMVPTAASLSKGYYPTYLDICEAVEPGLVKGSLSFEDYHLPPKTLIDF